MKLYLDTLSNTQLFAMSRFGMAAVGNLGYENPEASQVIHDMIDAVQNQLDANLGIKTN